jgi:ADP-ribose pyrophosphatase YjhB (NUDIX family)
MRPSKSPRPVSRYDISTIVFDDDGRILLGKRRSPNRFPAWGPPGEREVAGHMNRAYAMILVQKETGIEIHPPKHFYNTKNVHAKEYTYSTIFYVGRYKSGRLTLKEPHIIERWQWFDLRRLPSPLTLPFRLLLSQHGQELKSCAAEILNEKSSPT